jgi:toxin FitB
MHDGRVVDLDHELALIGADLSYEPKLPIADSIILATARANHATLKTQDEHYKNSEGVKYFQKKGKR